MANKQIVNTTQQILDFLQNKKNVANQTLFVGIDGGGGAGKSTLAENLERSTTEITTIHMDEFFVPLIERPQTPSSTIGDDYDIQKLTHGVLDKLKANEPAEYAVFDWNSQTYTHQRKIIPGGIIIIEGIFSGLPQLRKHYDVFIWVETPKEVRKSRVLERDGEHTRDSWEKDWFPQEERYHKTIEPFKSADIIVIADNNK